MPLEVFLVDFQMIGVSPQSLDLNQLFYPGLKTIIRISEVDQYLEMYYDKCKAICSTKDLDIFSLEELKEEYKAKEFFGFVMALGAIPFSMMRPSDVPDMTKLFSTSNRFSELKKYNENIANSVEMNPNTNERLLRMFDELDKIGFFSDNTDDAGAVSGVAAEVAEVDEVDEIADAIADAIADVDDA